MGRITRVENPIAAFGLLWALLVSRAAGAGEAGTPAPDFELPSLLEPSQTLALADFRGQVVYLDFWASWCGPCRRSFPVLEQLYADFADQGFTVLAVNVDEETELALDFLERYPVTYPLLLDPEGNTPGLYAIKGMPTAFLIDREGVVQHVHEGFKKSDGEAMRQTIEQMLAN